MIEQLSQPNNEKIQPWTVDGLKDFISQVRDKRSADWLEECGQIEAAIADLLEKPERFANVFRTKRGSYYFVLESGECLRFRHSQLSGEQSRRISGQQELNYFEIQPITQKVFFVDSLPNGGAIEAKEDQDGNILSMTFSPRTCENGKRPLEFGLSYTGYDRIGVEEIDGKVTVQNEIDSSSTDPKQELQLLIYHYGHEVAEIIR